MGQAKITTRLYSSRGESLKTLAGRVSPERADRFLCEIANVPERGGPELWEDYKKAMNRVWSLYQDLFPSHGNPEQAQYDETSGLAWEDPADPGPVWLDSIAPKLRQAWLIPTTLGREVLLMSEFAFYLRGPAMFAIAQKAHQARLEAEELAQKSGATPYEAFFAGQKAGGVIYGEEIRGAWTISDAAIDEFALVLLRAMHVAGRMMYCQNPSCPEPYFIAQRRSQKYCSDACSLPAQREFKRAWWSEHGPEWRKKQKGRKG